MLYPHNSYTRPHSHAFPHTNIKHVYFYHYSAQLLLFCNAASSESESEWALLPGVYIYEEFVFVTEASTVQQNNSDRTKNTDNKRIKIEQVNKE